MRTVHEKAVGDLAKPISGDLTYDIDDPVVDPDSPPWPLLGSGVDHVQFVMRLPGEAAKVDAPADVVEPGSGAVPPKVRYEWQPGDTDTKGVYRAWFVVHWDAGGGTQPETFPTRGHLTVIVGGGSQG